VYTKSLNGCLIWSVSRNPMIRTESLKRIAGLVRIHIICIFLI
jgi:hypothetical protein